MFGSQEIASLKLIDEYFITFTLPNNQLEQQSCLNYSYTNADVGWIYTNPKIIHSREIYEVNSTSLDIYLTSLNTNI